MATKAIGSRKITFSSKPLKRTLTAPAATVAIAHNCSSIMDFTPEIPRALSRREQRTLAIQVIYAQQGNRFSDFETFWQNINEMLDRKTSQTEFARKLVLGILEHVLEIDSQIQKFLRNWSLDRLNRIDLAILRLATYEMNYCDDIPPAVSINEAIELGKEFSAPESKAFINGVLDQIKKILPAKITQSVNSSATIQVPQRQ